MQYQITVLPQKLNLQATAGCDLLSVLRSAGLLSNAPCGGEGKCGKCRVIIDGKEVLACRSVVDRDMTVTLPTADTAAILTADTLFSPKAAGKDGFLLAFDIGTTTLAGVLMDANGTALASQGLANPQAAYGADVITRIRLALSGQQEALTAAVRNALESMTLSLCVAAKVDPAEITTVSIVGNSAMQQLYLGLSVQNLAQPPFAPVLTKAETVSAAAYLPVCRNAELLIVPDIDGFVGADTVACVLATNMNCTEETALLVDIGTNGEMVLGNKHRMIACSTAAGPALEGASIRFGMRAQTGAIDHVWLEDGQLRCSVIGGGKAIGICGSGLIDAVAAALELNLLNARGKILTDDNSLHLTEEIFLTQEDIRQLQLAKGAIAAGIRLMAEQMEIPLQDIDTVYLAGAFGTYMSPVSARRIGLLPKELEGKIQAVGNAALSGAKQLACHRDAPETAQEIVTSTQPLELSSLPQFPRCFAESMRF